MVRVVLNVNDQKADMGFSGSLGASQGFGRKTGDQT